VLISGKNSPVRLCVQVYKCQHGMAPAYLEELCWPVSDIDGRRHLRSARRGLLDVPRVELSTYGRRSFSYAGPSAWNALPDYLKNSTLSLSVFRNQLKHFLFSSYQYSQSVRGYSRNALYKLLTYLLTYNDYPILSETARLSSEHFSQFRSI